MSGDLRMPVLTVGLIGCGSIARSAHVPALLRASALVRVLSVCDIRPAVAEQVAHTLGAGWTSDYHQLLEDPRIDAVVITTPEFLHAEQAIAALEMGKHVLCEKPMARTLAEADAMIAAAEAADHVLGACDIFTNAPAGYPIHHELEVFGTRGMLRSRDPDSLALTRFDSTGVRFPTAAEALLLVLDAYALEQRLFFESILSGTPVPLSPRESRAALEMALAATRSSATGQPVTLPLSAA